MTTTARLSRKFDEVVEEIPHARLVAWDGCHKIYLAMDATEAAWFRENYETVVEDTPDTMLGKVVEWYEDSCALRFVQAVSHNEEDPNAGFRSLIEQGR